MPKKNFVEVKVIVLPGLTSGCACCGPSTGGPEGFTVEAKCDELRQALEEAYPGQTSTVYVDLLRSPEEKESVAGKLLVNKTYPSPIVVIDGEPVFAGSVQVLRIVREVGKIIES